MLPRHFFITTIVSLLTLEAKAYATCGNGTLDAGETCEDGNTTNGDGCDDTCAIESGWDCTEAVFELQFENTYTQDNHASPIWGISTDGRTVNQSENSKPTIYVSSLPATGVTATFTLQVDSVYDDDYIGWAIGYEDGDFYNANAK